jgi:peptidoglycan/xylan/chitin deacetylase (PgdA/CDA1 family)
VRERGSDLRAIHQAAYTLQSGTMPRSRLALRAAAALLCLAACTRGRPAAPILNYHAVGPGADEFTVEETEFARQLDVIASAGLRTVPLLSVAEGGDLRGAVVLTFDDGTEDAVTRVLPQLRKRGMRGTFFVITGLVGKPGYLTWDGVRALAAAGMEIGSHTVTHAHLADLPEERVVEELTKSKADLEAHLGAPVAVLAYPYNSVRAGIERAAREAGYRAAAAGMVHGSDDPLRLYRTTIRRSTTLEELRRAITRG